MPAPDGVLPLLHHLPQRTPTASLGGHIAAHLTDGPAGLRTLLDCLPDGPRPALHSPDPDRPPLDYATLRRTLASFRLPTSKRALSRPLRSGDRVLVALPTGPENALILLAIAAYYTAAPVNAACTADEARDDARRLGARAIVTTREAIERLHLAALYADGIEIILVDFRHMGPAGLFDLAVMDGPHIVTPPTVHPAHAPQPNALMDQALVLHTSGTSGTKKVVPYTLRHLIVGTCCVVHSWKLAPDSVNMNMMPLFHVGGIVRNLMAPLFSGGSTIMCSGFDPANWWTIVRRLGATWYYAAPTMHHAILSTKPRALNIARDIKIKMICNAAGGLLPSLATEMQQTFQCAILPSYGMTECMPIASPATTYRLDRPGYSGVACGPDLSVRDPANLECALPVGVTGAVCVRGLPTFDGYELPGGKLDTSCFTSAGWFDSGDVGEMDPTGWLKITGRSKEIINKGGEVISPFEVEEAIMHHLRSTVKATLAFSIDHDVLQETIGVVIVPQPNKPRIGLLELQNTVRDALHPSKWPFTLVYMDDLPKNNAGKPLRIKLGQRLGLGPMNDDTPLADRHWEAQVPDKNTPLSTPIPCRKVAMDLNLIHQACQRIPEVQETAVRLRRDGAPEAFVHLAEGAPYTAADLDRALAEILPGYLVPSPLHVFRQSLARTKSGGYDFQAMEDEVRAYNSAELTRTARAVRDCIARLLAMDPASITAESDFFLLGGTSLLLGRLVHSIKKETGAGLEVSSVFVNPTVQAIARLVDQQLGSDEDDANDEGYWEESAGLLRSPAHAYEDDGNTPEYLTSHGQQPRSQTNLLVLLVQWMPLMLFYPLKAAWTWTVLIHGLGFSAYYINDNFWQRVGVLLASLFVAGLSSRIICPITAIAFKWLVIGRYRPGKYPMWCNYHLRWWIVNQSLDMAGKGLFNLTPWTRLCYYRVLGASIGKDVKIDKFAKIAEFDLLTIHDGARIDRSVIRGFCVERDAYFRLEPVVVGRQVIVNTYTQISPGAYLADDTVWGPQASSHDQPSEDGFAAYNKGEVPQPHILLILLLGLPIKYGIRFLCYVPWFAALFMLLSQPFVFSREDSVKGVIAWFAYARRIKWHYVARIVRNCLPPLSEVLLGIVVKRLFLGLNTEGAMQNASQWALFRRWLCSELLSQPQLRRGFAIIGTHYEMTSVVYRAMGAQVGRRVYWPGSGIYCPDPELLRIGHDVVFGSRSEIITSDSLGFARVSIASGAMVADRVTLLPGTTVDRQAVMGSGALSRRNGYYDPLSVWMGNKQGEAVSFGKSLPTSDDSGDSMVTPFGRAFYQRKAPYFVIPYPIIVLINAFVSVLSAVYWATPAAATILILNRCRKEWDHKAPGLFSDHWYRPALVYVFFALAFMVIMTIQALLAFAWVIGTKWILIGRRKEGRYDWDKSSYCQRWQLHLALSRVLGQGFGGRLIGCISGSWYAVAYLRLLGARIGKDCAIWAGGRPSLQLTEPELVTMGNRVSMDDASVVGHLNSRGHFSLNKLIIGDGCALRTGSRLLSGACMEPHSILLEHTLVASGEIADAGQTYAGWPARQLRFRRGRSAALQEKVLDPRPGMNLDLDSAHSSSIILSRAPPITRLGHLQSNSLSTLKT